MQGATKLCLAGVLFILLYAVLAPASAGFLDSLKQTWEDIKQEWKEAKENIKQTWEEEKRKIEQ
ncbi:MAG: hypothetical protein DRP01_05735, partial [Archaeoglobales archaeon]